MARGKPGLLELLQPHALPAPPKEVDDGPVPDTTDDTNLPAFGLDSLSPRLIITPEKSVPDNGIITLDIVQNFTSLTPTTLTIDQTDPTDVKFSAVGGGVAVGNLFGPSHTILVAGSVGQGAFTFGTEERAHPFISYNASTGVFTINRAGTYLIQMQGTIANVSNTGGGSIIATFTGTTSTLATGYPPNQINDKVYTQDQLNAVGSSEFMESSVIFAAAGTLITPELTGSMNTNWSNRRISITSMYGPGSLNETQWELTTSYRYEAGFIGDAGPYSWVGFDGAPYGTNGAVPSHVISSIDPYYGDAANPIWYPDSQMYVGLFISPYPNLLDGDLTATVTFWEGAAPSDVEVGVAKFNVGSGLANQGIYVRLPRTAESYVGTSFKILLTAEGIVSNHEIFFKYSADGQNGCATTGPGTFNLGLYAYNSNNDGTIVPSTYFGGADGYANYNSYPFWTQFFQQVTSSTFDRNYYSLHLTIEQGTYWKDPQTVTWEITWLGGVRLTANSPPNNYELIDPSFLTEPASPPTITYWSDIGDVDDWNKSPVGHWQLRQAMNQDYWHADPNWIGYPTLEAPHEFVPSLYEITMKDGAGYMTSFQFTMGFNV